MKKSVRCTYLKSCYLAEALECYGFKTDCPLYLRINGEQCNDIRFDSAMDELILRTKRKHDLKKRVEAGKSEISTTKRSIRVTPKTKVPS
jgi:hypothetical protein